MKLIFCFPSGGISRINEGRRPVATHNPGINLPLSGCDSLLEVCVTLGGEEGDSGLSTSIQWVYLSPSMVITTVHEQGQPSDYRSPSCLSPCVQPLRGSCLRARWRGALALRWRWAEIVWFRTAQHLGCMWSLSPWGWLWVRGAFDAVKTARGCKLPLVQIRPTY